MSQIPTYVSCILNEGKFAIGQAMTQRKKMQAYKFIVGDATNFTPDETGTTVLGNVVYEGRLIQGTITAKDTFKYNLTIPEGAGPFTVGNIILYVQSDDGTVFPFIHVALKVPYPKTGQLPGTIGNRFVFQLIEKIVNVADVLDLTVVPSDYFSLASFSKETELPQPEDALFQQFVIHEPLIAPVPILGARRAADNKYFGMPLPFKIGEPFFGVLDGGRAGELQSPIKESYFWGGRLSMKPEQLTRVYGGGNLTNTTPHVIGGGKLPENPGYTL